MNGSFDFETFYTIFMSVYIGVFGAMALALVIVEYVFTGKGLSELARRRGVGNPAFAWVPLLNMMLLGKLAEQFETAQLGTTRKHSKRLLVTGILVAVITTAYFIVLIPFMTSMFNGIIYNQSINNDILVEQLLAWEGVIVVLALALTAVTIPQAIFMGMAYYKVFYSAKPKLAGLFTALSLLVSMFGPIALFVLRKKDEGFIALQEKRQQ